MGQQQLLSFHDHHNGGYYGSKKEGCGAQQQQQQQQLPRKGWMAVRVGEREEEQERFVVPVGYLNHPLFVRLLKEAEEEYGFHHRGAITIPCHVDYFRQVQSIIDRETPCRTTTSSGLHTNHHHLLHFHLSGCFKA